MSELSLYPLKDNSEVGNDSLNKSQLDFEVLRRGELTGVDVIPGTELRRV